MLTSNGKTLVIFDRFEIDFNLPKHKKSDDSTRPDVEF